MALCCLSSITEVANLTPERLHRTGTFDLKVARKKSGLTQNDCSHLVGVSRSTLSQIELGERMPSIKELISMSLLFGRSFDSLYADLLAEVRVELTDKLQTMPDE
ncbi:MAG: helix-turn-helix transcriptional regulator [Pseudoruegeria sp.]